MKRILRLTVAACAMGLAQPAAPSDRAICFSAADNARLPFTVIQQAPPPQDAATPYRFYPFNTLATRQLGSLRNLGEGYAGYLSLWANRQNAPLRNEAGRLLPRKLNFQPSLAGNRRQRTAFSSVGKADACTLAQAAYVLGQPARASKFARTGGITMVDENAQPDASATGPADRCVMPAGTLPAGAKGILLDFEVQDGRDPEAALAFLTRFAELVHGAGKKSILLLNPFDSAGQQRYSGITSANAHKIVAAFDQTGLLLWGGNPEHSVPASYAAQMAIIAAGGPVDRSRLLINFELAGTTLEDARFAGRTIREQRLAGVMFWRNHADLGGGCESDANRKIAAIVFGEADAPRR